MEEVKKAFLEVYRHESAVINDCYDRLMASIYLSAEKKENNMFAFLGCSPKVGTTTIAINSAVSLANSNWKTLMIDADFRKNATNKRLSSEIKQGLADYLMGKAGMNEIICETNIKSLSYISCGSAVDNPVQLICSENFQKLIKEIRHQFDYIIFDASSINTYVDAVLIAKMVDNAILIVSQNETKKKDYKSALAELEKVNATIFGVVLNKIDKDEYRNNAEIYRNYRPKGRK